MTKDEQPEDYARPEDIEFILRNSRIIAVVGLSDDPARPSNRVARYLQSAGYRVIPVNPKADEMLGEKSYPDLASIPEKVDVVDIFRRPSQVMPHIEEAIAIGAPAVWLQERVINREAAARARAAGLRVVMDRCMAKEHSRLTYGEGE